VRLGITYRVRADSSVLNALHRALVPEILSLPSTCTGEVSTTQSDLVILVECSSLSKLRAVNNNLIGLVILLLRIVGELSNDRDST